MCRSAWGLHRARTRSSTQAARPAPAAAPCGTSLPAGRQNLAAPAPTPLQPPPAEPNRIQKKKVWEAVQPKLRTGSDLIANYEGRQMLTSAGPVAAATLGGANIS